MGAQEDLYDVSAPYSDLHAVSKMERELAAVAKQAELDQLQHDLRVVADDDGMHWSPWRLQARAFSMKAIAELQCEGS